MEPLAKWNVTCPKRYGVISKAREDDLKLIPCSLIIFPQITNHCVRSLATLRPLKWLPP